MDIELARTFLEIVRCGSFVAAAEPLHLTQTAVTARVRNLERQLDCRLFLRGRDGVRLTAEGERFVRHAQALVRTWDTVRQELPLAVGEQRRLVLGSEPSLSNPLLFNWVARLRQCQDIPLLHVEVAEGEQLQRLLEDGEVDAALLYRPRYTAGLQIELLQEERLVMARSPLGSEPYVQVDWGEEFRRQHDAALPGQSRAALTFNLGPLALQYVASHGGCGYFRQRAIQQHLQDGSLIRVADAPEFTYPVHLVYPRRSQDPALEQALGALRTLVAE